VAGRLRAEPGSAEDVHDLVGRVGLEPTVKGFMSPLHGPRRMDRMTTKRPPTLDREGETIDTDRLPRLPGFCGLLRPGRGLRAEGRGGDDELVPSLRPDCMKAGLSRMGVVSHVAPLSVARIAASLGSALSRKASTCFTS
jgi:hypothetical protein